MPAFKALGLAFILTSLTYLMVMKYIFQDNGIQNVVMAVIAGIGCAAATFFITRKKADKKI
ncbi:hypothetical protein [Mucilaginibacter sp.]|uniref:hypothetical protein n=1 Tax=Mucilaginibacter sp. TaxID=1882438 RepID=UPI003D13CCE9